MHARGVTIEAPIPIDDIIEKHLKIGHRVRRHAPAVRRIGFDPDIMGAIYFEHKRIVIDESLDPDENPAKEGRDRYTAAHEVGHWRLHRHLFGNNPAQASHLDANAPPSVICRTSQAKARIEVQADRYASCLLMPRKLIFAPGTKHSPTASSECVSLPNRSTTPLSRSRASKAAFRAPPSPKVTITPWKTSPSPSPRSPGFADRHAYPA